MYKEAIKVFDLFLTQGWRGPKKTRMQPDGGMDPHHNQENIDAKDSQLVRSDARKNILVKKPVGDSLKTGDDAFLNKMFSSKQQNMDTNLNKPEIQKHIPEKEDIPAQERVHAQEGNPAQEGKEGVIHGKELTDEYEQYLDDDENLNFENIEREPIKSGKSDGLKFKPQEKPFVGHDTHQEMNDDIEQGYHYYENRDNDIDRENLNDDEKYEEEEEEEEEENFYPHNSKTRKKGPSKGGKDTKNLMPRPYDQSSVGKAYLLLVITMVGLVYIMYRFVKQRRVIIKYHHRPTYR